MPLLRWLTNLFSRRASRPAHLRLGEEGERIAALVLQERGMELLCRNYREAPGEIDLVCRENGILCFVEVKTRHRQKIGQPADAVDAAKRRNLIQTARKYRAALGNPQLSSRFDIVEIIYDGARPSEIYHWPDAFQDKGK